MPQSIEICGNCLDDDGNGLADYDDAACCSGTEPRVMELDSVRIRPREDGSKVRLRATLGGLVLDDLSVPTRALALQLGDEIGDDLLFCARVEPERLRASHRVLRFRDRRGEVASANGLGNVRLRLTRQGRLKFTASGKRAAIVARGSHELRITVAVQDLGQIGLPTQCVSATEPVRQTTGGGIRFP